MTKMLISEAIKWWFRITEKLPDGSAKIFEEDNNRLAEEVAKLEALNKRIEEAFTYSENVRRSFMSKNMRLLEQNKKLKEDLDMERTMRVGAQQDYFYQKEQAEKYAEKYNELIMFVATKHPSETRHETAMRYIVERENQNLGPQSSKQKVNNG